MVRLKLKNKRFRINYEAKSQFHYGSIKTPKRIAKYYLEALSQFHYGSIKTDYLGKEFLRAF